MVGWMPSSENSPSSVYVGSGTEEPGVGHRVEPEQFGRQLVGTPPAGSRPRALDIATHSQTVEKTAQVEQVPVEPVLRAAFTDAMIAALNPSIAESIARASSSVMRGSRLGSKSSSVIHGRA